MAARCGPDVFSSRLRGVNGHHVPAHLEKWEFFRIPTEKSNSFYLSWFLEPMTIDTYVVTVVQARSG
jgi:hypothetical protein